MVSRQYRPCVLWITYCTLLLSCLTSLSLEANELTLTPKTCAVTREKPVCQFNLLIEYQSDIPRSLCILIAQQAITLACFENKLEFKYQVQLSLTEDTLFEIRDQKDNTKLTSELVKVAKFEPTNTRRRRGLNWNLL